MDGLSFEIEHLDGTDGQKLERYRTVGLDGMQSRHHTVSENEEER